jgi:hypothetical protein
MLVGLTGIEAHPIFLLAVIAGGVLFFGAVIYSGSIRCMKCSRSLIYVMGKHWGFPADVRFCPYCGGDLDAPIEIPPSV